MIAITIFMGPIPAWARSKSDRTFSTEFHHAEKVTTRAQPGPIESNAVPDRPSSLTDYERVAFRSAPESAGPALFGRAQSLATPAHNVGRSDCRHNLAHPKGSDEARRLEILLQGFAVLRNVETLQLLLNRNPQDHERAHHLEQDERHAA